MLPRRTHRDLRRSKSVPGSLIPKMKRLLMMFGADGKLARLNEITLPLAFMTSYYFCLGSLKRGSCSCLTVSVHCVDISAFTSVGSAGFRRSLMGRLGRVYGLSMVL